ncbi:MAG TPA: hypothetical protein VGO84_11765, partial [Burkholderiales bacterium]|nr:hypothetical protein [Burkholderiales bacterium]
RRKGHYERLWRHQSGGFIGHEVVATETATEPIDDEPATDKKHIEPMAEPGTDDAPVATQA